MVAFVVADLFRVVHSVRETEVVVEPLGLTLAVSVREARPTHDVGILPLHVRVQHEQSVLVFRESHEVSPPVRGDVLRRRHVMVSDHRVEPTHQVELARAKVDEPGDRRSLTADDLDRGFIELFQEGHVVGDVRSGQCFRCDRPARDAIRVDVGVHAHAVRGSNPIREFMGPCFHLPLRLADLAQEGFREMAASDSRRRETESGAGETEVLGRNRDLDANQSEQDDEETDHEARDPDPAGPPVISRRSKEQGDGEEEPADRGQRPCDERQGGDCGRPGQECQ